MMTYSNRKKQYLPISLALVVLLNILPANDGYAQNNERKGFILGFGAGISHNSYQFSSGGFEGEKENVTAVATNFKLGFAPTNQIAIYWNSQVAFFNMDDGFGDNIFTLNGIGGLGGSYFLNETAPSIYVNAIVGFSNWGSISDSTTDNLTGFGFGIGGGYEFARHWTADCNLTIGKPKEDSLELDVSSVRVTINYLMY